MFISSEFWFHINGKRSDDSESLAKFIFSFTFCLGNAEV